MRVLKILKKCGGVLWLKIYPITTLPLHVGFVGIHAVEEPYPANCNLGTAAVCVEIVNPVT